MKTLTLMIFLTLTSCATTKEYSATPEDISRKADPAYTQDSITQKLNFEDFDKDLSRFYVAPNSPQFAAIPVTGALIDNIAFSKSSKDDYNKFEYRKIADRYKAFLFNKTSCFYTFIKGPNADLKNYDLYIGNTGEPEHRAVVKAEQEHLSFLTILNGKFPKTYSEGKARSITTDVVYSQDLVCGNKIDFKKPFYIQLRSKTDKNVIELYWL